METLYSYRLQSLGKVEKANSFIKTQLAKLTLELQQPWTKLVSMALTRIRASPRSPSFLALLSSCVANSTFLTISPVKPPF